MTIARFTQWCQFSHGHEMQTDQYGSWVRALDYESLAASCARAAKDAVQFQDERDEARRRLAEAERLMRSAVEFWEWEVSGGLRFEFQDFLRASDNGAVHLPDDVVYVCSHQHFAKKPCPHGCNDDRAVDNGTVSYCSEHRNPVPGCERCNIPIPPDSGSAVQEINEHWKQWDQRRTPDSADDDLCLRCGSTRSSHPPGGPLHHAFVDEILPPDPLGWEQP